MRTKDEISIIQKNNLTQPAEGNNTVESMISGMEASKKWKIGDDNYEQVSFSFYIIMMIKMLISIIFFHYWVVYSMSFTIRATSISFKPILNTSMETSYSF